MTKTTADELREQSRAADREDKELGELMQGLVKHPGWAAFTTLLNKNMQGAADTLMQSEQQLVAGGSNSEYVKGTMRGLMVARDLPYASIATMKSLSSEPGQETES